MKKWISFLMAAVLSLTLIGCGGDPAVSQPSPEPQQELQLLPNEEVTADEEIAEADSEEDAEQPGEIAEEAPAEELEEIEEPEAILPEDGVYTSKDDVALYIHLYGHLPDNFITKKEAEKLGWPGGSLEPYAPGKCIGGSYFGNNEGLLPEAKGRKYTECDIDTLGAAKRGAKRIVFSNDGLIYYTGDHYESFELLYGEE